MSRGLRGFASLRTRLTERPTPKPKRICPGCGAVLAKSNPGPLCRPCEYGHVVDLSWELEQLVDAADRCQLNAIAKAIYPALIRRRKIGGNNASK